MAELAGPKYERGSFVCPHCHAFAQQEWSSLFSADFWREARFSRDPQQTPFAQTECQACSQVAVWRDEEMIWPTTNLAPAPNADLPEDVASDYREAALIAAESPRGASALLRLSIQKLCVHLGGKGKNINDDIGRLVNQGLPDRIQRALDAVRVIGNNAVHPGQMDSVDDPETARSLFVAINLIASTMITEPNEINALYEGLPEGAKKAIEKRDEQSK